MKNLLFACVLLFIAATTAHASPFSDISDYTVQFTLDCGPGETIAQRIVADYKEFPVLQGNSHAVEDSPVVSVMINADTGDYTIVLSAGNDACILDYGVFKTRD